MPEITNTQTNLHFGSYSLVVEPTAASFLNLAQREKRKHLISLDPNVRLTIEPDIEIWRQQVDKFSKLADLVKVSDEDLAQLYPGESFESVANRWRGYGVQFVVITRGELGTTAYLKDDVYQASGQSVTIIDSVGAGDSFQTALLCGLEEIGKAGRTELETLTPEECQRVVEFANQAASITCTRRSAELPRRDQLPAIYTNGQN